MNWYARKSTGTGQGIVIDEDTGRTVAVSYEEKDAALIAAAPALLAVVKDLVRSEDEGPSAPGVSPRARYLQARAAIAQTEEPIK
jgi:hypothetical protein